jgi:hypothetical protein
MMWKWRFNLQTKPVMFLTCSHTLFILWTRPLYLMFVPCIIRRSRNDQQYAHICTTALFYIPAPTCFGSSLPSSGSFWIHPSYMKIQIGLVVYHITLVKWPECRSVMVPSVVLPSSWAARSTTPRAVFTHGPKGPGPRAANFQGRHINKKSRLKYGMRGGKKGCPRERSLREIYTENTMCCFCLHITEYAQMVGGRKIFLGPGA